MQIQDYSDKCIVLRGEGIMTYMTELENMKGLYNARLKDKETQNFFRGFIFPKRRRQEIEDWLNKKGGKVEEKNLEEDLEEEEEVVPQEKPPRLLKMSQPKNPKENQNLLSVSNDFIDSLFSNPYFLNKLKSFIGSNK